MTNIFPLLLHKCPFPFLVTAQQPLVLPQASSPCGVAHTGGPVLGPSLRIFHLEPDFVIVLVLWKLKIINSKIMSFLFGKKKKKSVQRSIKEKIKFHFTGESGTKGLDSTFLNVINTQTCIFKTKIGDMKISTFHLMNLQCLPLCIT